MKITAVIWDEAPSAELEWSSRHAGSGSRVVTAIADLTPRPDAEAIDLYGVESPVDAYARIAAEDSGEVIVLVRAGAAIELDALPGVLAAALTGPCLVVRPEDVAAPWEDVLGYGRPAVLVLARAAYLAAGAAAPRFAAAAELELLLRLGTEPAVLDGLLVSRRKARRRQAIEHATRAGAVAPPLVEAHPSALACLPIGGYVEASPAELAIRRVLLTLRIRPLRLARGRLGERSAFERLAYWHGVRRTVDSEQWARLTRGTTILMYHAFSARGERPSQLIVSSRRFRMQLRWLRAIRRPVLTVGEYIALRRAGDLPPARATVITSDDGYLDNKSIALPALRAAGFRATLFVVTGSIGASNKWDRNGELTERRLLDEASLRELAQSGIEIGNHTRTHPQLPDLTAEQVREELLGAQADLERAGVAASRVVAYPHGRRSAAVEDVVEQSGFLGACGVDAGLNCARTPLAALRRTRVDGRHGLIRFAIAVACGDPTPFRTQLKSFRPHASATHVRGKTSPRHR